MNDHETLAITLAPTIATGAGKTVIGWLKRRFSSDAAKVADTLAADPNNDDAKKILAGILKAEFEKSRSLADELRVLLDQVGTNYAPQTSTVSVGSTNIQIQGNNNRV